MTNIIVWIDLNKTCVHRAFKDIEENSNVCDIVLSIRYTTIVVQFTLIVIRNTKKTGWILTTFKFSKTSDAANIQLIESFFSTCFTFGSTSATTSLVYIFLISKIVKKAHIA